VSELVGRAAPGTVAELMRHYAAALSRELLRPVSSAARQRVHEEYAGLVGSWVCRGVMRGPAYQGERAIEATLQCAFSSNGLWLCAHYVEHATAENPAPGSATDYWGYDEDAGSLVRFGFGGARTGFFGVSGGFSRGCLIWSGVWLDERGSVPSRDALCLDGDHLDIKGELRVMADAWQPVAQLECRRHHRVGGA
jgi:hypothetical protein